MHAVVDVVPTEGPRWFPVGKLRLTALFVPLVKHFVDSHTGWLPWRFHIRIIVFLLGVGKSNSDPVV